MLAENIVHRYRRENFSKNLICFYNYKNCRAIDMERSRQAELKRHLETMSKAALVNSVKV